MSDTQTIHNTIRLTFRQAGPAGIVMANSFTDDEARGVLKGNLMFTVSTSASEIAPGIPTVTTTEFETITAERI